MGFDREFEELWLGKFSTCLKQIAGEEVYAHVFGRQETGAMNSEQANAISWTRQAMDRLELLVGDELSHEIFCGCACQFPQEELRIIRKVFRITGDLTLAQAMLQDQFDQYLKEKLQLDAEIIEEIKTRNWGTAGKMLGSTIVITRIPNVVNVKEYFAASEPEARRRLYCHCPRIWEAVQKGERLSSTYCYCGAGFYKYIWEEIIGTQVDVEVLESILGGGDVCRFAIYLPLDMETSQPS